MAYCSYLDRKCTTLKAEGATCQNYECQTGLTCIANKCAKPSSNFNCTAAECPGDQYYGNQVCECPTAAFGAGTCRGSDFSIQFHQKNFEFFDGKQSAASVQCLIYSQIPAGFVDPTIVNLICTASVASTMSSSIILGALAFLIAMLLFE